MILTFALSIVQCVLAVGATHSTMDGPNEWVEQSVTALLKSTANSISRQALTEIALYTHNHIFATIPLEAQKYIDAACTPNKSGYFQAAWTYGIMAFITSAKGQYDVNAIIVLLNSVATRQSLVSSLSLDSMPPVKYILTTPEKFTSGIVKAVAAKIFKAPTLSIWISAPSITVSLAKSALNNYNKDTMAALQSWCSYPGTVSIGVLEKILEYMIVYRHDKAANGAFTDYIRKHANGVEMQAFQTLYKAIPKCFLTAAPLKSMKQSFAAFGQSYPSLNSENNLDVSYTQLAEAVAAHEAFAKGKGSVNFSYANVLRYYSADTVDQHCVFPLLLAFGHDGSVPPINHCIAEGTDYSKPDSILYVLQKIVDYNIEFLSTDDLVNFLNNVNTYDLLQFCKDSEFNSKLQCLALKTPGVLGVAMLAFTKLSKLNVTFDPGSHAVLNCTVAAMAFSKEELVSVPNFCQNADANSKSSLAEYISAFIAESRENIEEHFKPVEIVYHSALGSSVNHLNDGHVSSIENWAPQGLPQITMDYYIPKVLNNALEEHVVQTTDSAFGRLHVCGVILLILAMCAAAAVAFKLVKRKPESDIEAPPAEPDGGKAAPEASEEPGAKATEQTSN